MVEGTLKERWWSINRVQPKLLLNPSNSHHTLNAVNDDLVYYTGKQQNAQTVYPWLRRSLVEEIEPPKPSSEEDEGDQSPVSSSFRVALSPAPRFGKEVRFGTKTPPNSTTDDRDATRVLASTSYARTMRAILKLGEKEDIGAGG